MPQFYVETYGCTANMAASELMSYLLQNCGHSKTTSLVASDFVLVNTCVVKAPTEHKIKDFLEKVYQKKPLIIAGCLPQVMMEWCREKVPNAALVGVDHFSDICLAAKAVLKGEPFKTLSRQKNFCETTQRLRARPLTGIVEISKGCTGRCSYCIVKLAKGTLVSKKPALILEEIQTALNEGCKELWLTAQDTASYGIDISETLPGLVAKVSALEGKFKIRVGMMNADYALKILPALKEMYQNPKVYSFAHIPIQSGSNRVLKKMNRKYSVEEFKYLVAELRKATKLTLSTDLIPGFPGETAKDHQQTIALLQRVKFDIVNISKYGDRKGTVASKSPEKLPTEVVKKRSSELTKLVAKMTLERNKSWVGWEGEALALRRTEKTNTTLLRNHAYKLVALPGVSLPLGKYYNVTITKALKTRLLGKIVNKEQTSINKRPKTSR